MNFKNAFISLDAILKQYQAYWYFVPFQQAQLWSLTDSKKACLLSEADSQTKAVLLSLFGDKLAQKLQQIDADHFAQIDGSFELQKKYFMSDFPEIFQWFEQHSIFEDNAFMQSQVEPDTTPANGNDIPFWFSTGIGGRKWLQITALSKGIKKTNYPLVEWCAGKGHLGRLLAFQHQSAVTSIEWQQALCDKGEALAQQFNLPQQFIQADVLKDERPLIQADQHVVALHACGDLHVTLLDKIAQQKPKEVSLSPCCYHLIKAETYQPLSQLAQQSELKLSRDILKLAVQAQITGGNRITTLRRKEVAWRLAYQALRAQLTQQSSYQSLPSVNKAWFSGEFKAFALWGLEHQKLVETNKIILADIDWDFYENIGWCQAPLIQQMELIRHIFRRPLELWLVLDRVLFLQEQGYQVSLNQFCDYQITPRNLLIKASL